MRKIPWSTCLPTPPNVPLRWPGVKPAWTRREARRADSVTMTTVAQMDANWGINAAVHMQTDLQIGLQIGFSDDRSES